MGVAIDAASRGYDTLLLEQSDFGKGTSSRSTKLVHGGVRYLEQGNISLVMEALKERGLLRQNAPHLVSDLGFRRSELRLVGSALLWLGPEGLQSPVGKIRFRRHRKILSKEETLQLLPTIKTGRTPRRRRSITTANSTMRASSSTW